MFLSTLCRVFTIIYLKQMMFIEYSVATGLCLLFVPHTWSVRKVSDLWPGKRNWLTWSV